MGTYFFNKEQILNISLNEAWSFFSSPLNLAKITPPELEFKILSPVENKKIYSGMEINYLVKPFLGIPVKWKTRIDEVVEPFRFTDKQDEGPYKIWEHTHTFVKQGDATLMIDDIKYKLPFGFAGDLAHTLLVRKKIKAIFDYRFLVLDKLFA